MDVCMMYGFITSDTHLHIPAGSVDVVVKRSHALNYLWQAGKVFITRRFHDVKLKRNRGRQSTNFFISFYSDENS